MKLTLLGWSRGAPCAKANSCSHCTWDPGLLSSINSPWAGSSGGSTCLVEDLKVMSEERWNNKYMSSFHCHIRCIKFKCHANFHPGTVWLLTFLFLNLGDLPSQTCWVSLSFRCIWMYNYSLKVDTVWLLCVNVYWMCVAMYADCFVSHHLRSWRWCPPCLLECRGYTSARSASSWNP